MQFGERIRIALHQQRIDLGQSFAELAEPRFEVRQFLDESFVSVEWT